MNAFFDFDVVECRRQKIKAYYNLLKASGRNVYIYGAGEYAELLKTYLNKKGISVKGLTLSGQFASKIPGVLPLNDVVSHGHMSLIYGLENGFSKWFYKKIEQLQEEIKKYDDVDFFVPSDYWLTELGPKYFSHEFIDEKYLRENFEAFELTYGMLSDELSRMVMKEYLYSSLCQDASQLASLGSDWKYDYDWDLLFKKCDGDIVIECGAFNGKSIAEACEFTQQKYEMIALECDSENYKKCCNRVQNLPNVKVLNYGVWNKKTKLAVVQLDSASFLKEVDDDTDSRNVVEVLNIDSLAHSKKIAAIIMDIEGSEMNALMGAQNAIRDGANLAVRVYHRKDDLITIPQYIKSLNENYKIYMRHERGASLCRTGDETTLYAICSHSC